MDPRTRVLLEAPITRRLLRLATPTSSRLGAQAAAGLVEVHFIGKLGYRVPGGRCIRFPGPSCSGSPSCSPPLAVAAGVQYQCIGVGAARTAERACDGGRDTTARCGR